MSNVLVIPDVHLPCEHKGALQFLIKVKKKYKCDKVVCIGDMVDQYCFSTYTKDPEAPSTQEEINATKKKLKSWAKAFPKMSIVYGNHDLRLVRQAAIVGIPKQFITPLNEVYDLPSTWTWHDEVVIDGVLYVHEGGIGGKYAHIRLAERNQQSTVMGHLHSSPGVGYMANRNRLIFGMNVGCLVDRHTYAFHYAKKMPKQVLSCGVVLDGGKLPIVVPFS